MGKVAETMAAPTDYEIVRFLDSKGGWSVWPSGGARGWWAESGSMRVFAKGGDAVEARRLLAIKLGKEMGG